MKRLVDANELEQKAISTDDGYMLSKQESSENKKTYGCSRCPHRPGTAEEWSMAFQDPTTYCPDAYSKQAPYCGLYDGGREDPEEMELG